MEDILKEFYNNDGLGNIISPKKKYLRTLYSNIKTNEDKTKSLQYTILVKNLLKKERAAHTIFVFPLFYMRLYLIKKNKNIVNEIKNLLRKKKVNWLLTMYVNFRVLPISQAVKMPIFVYGWLSCSLRGQVVIQNAIKRGMIKFGNDPVGFMVARKSKLFIAEDAKIVFHGEANFNQGFSVIVSSKGILELGKRASIGDNVMVVCKKSIFIGERVHITWECQVMDSNFHYIEYLDEQYITDICNPVYIGNYCWIGNRTTIMPNTVLPDRTIVASNSLLNKDYVANGIKSYSLIGGIPAKLLATQVKRIYSVENEFFLADYFLNNKENVSSLRLPVKE